MITAICLLQVSSVFAKQPIDYCNGIVLKGKKFELVMEDYGNFEETISLIDISFDNQKLKASIDENIKVSAKKRDEHFVESFDDEALVYFMNKFKISNSKLSSSETIELAHAVTGLALELKENAYEMENSVDYETCILTASNDGEDLFIESYEGKILISNGTLGELTLKKR